MTRVTNRKLALSEDEIRTRIASLPYWFHRIEVAPGIVTPGEDDTALKLERLNIPDDLSGKRVLDIGAYEGFFSFECERRGAEVVAIDTIAPDACGFSIAHELLGSRVKWCHASIYDLNPEDFGQFDLVLCLGVIYHLRHPLLGLERVHSVCKGQLILETQICDRFFIGLDGTPVDLDIAAPTLLKIPIAQFYPGAELNSDPSNWWSPNIVALLGMLRSTGFVPEKTIADGVRACIHCSCVEGPVQSPWLETTPDKPPAHEAGGAPSTYAVITLADLLIESPQNIASELIVLDGRPVLHDQPAPVMEPGSGLTELTPDMLREQTAISAHTDVSNRVPELPTKANFPGGSAEHNTVADTMSVISPLARAAHERRVALLGNLPIGNISDKVCVDYGVGRAGFGAVYPKLQSCAYAIGMDIAVEALQASAAISANNDFSYGSNYTYMRSREDDLPFKEACVDILFVGDCLEEIANTDAFLDQVHRVLKPGGIFILTAHNADAYMFRINGAQYGLQPERVSLMSYAELRYYLDVRFEILEVHGYNSSLYHAWDSKIDDLETARIWVAQFTDRPDMGTGVVLLARRRDDYRSARYTQRRYQHDAPEINYEGLWQTALLHETMVGRRGSDGDSSLLTLDFQGNGIIINFWSHRWSGRACVEVDGVADYVDLYSSLGGLKKVHIGNLTLGRHRLRIYGNQAHDPRGQSNEVIFYQAISYQRLVEEQATA
jgi:2-polyprenyl-3-methyl-5-hydroxy-6-metoxy-1,4-benzoquinol methylase